MRKSFQQTLAILAICLLLIQTFFGSLPVHAQTNSNALIITMLENGQPYEEGDVATGPVTIQVVPTSPDSAGIELSQDLGTTWEPYDITVPLVLEDAGNHEVWFKIANATGLPITEKRRVQITTPALFATQSTGSVIYVDEKSTAANGGDGTSWATAFKDLQAALTAAVAGQEIWIAKGTYTPIIEVYPGFPRSTSFQMINNVAIYGGFSGTEMALAERDLINNITYLSGDIGIINDDTDNAYHVFYHPEGINLDNTALLSDVTITKGRAGKITDTTGPPQVDFQGAVRYLSGSGMLNHKSHPTLVNVIFEDNVSGMSGGGMHNDESNPDLISVIFKNNIADNSGGGGMSNYKSSPSLDDVTFENNTATYGGGMSNSESDIKKIENTKFINNKVTSNGGGLHNTSTTLTLTDVIFEENNSISFGGAMYVEESEVQLN